VLCCVVLCCVVLCCVCVVLCCVVLCCVVLCCVVLCRVVFWRGEVCCDEVCWCGTSALHTWLAHPEAWLLGRYRRANKVSVTTALDLTNVASGRCSIWFACCRVPATHAHQQHLLPPSWAHSPVCVWEGVVGALVAIACSCACASTCHQVSQSLQLRSASGPSQAREARHAHAARQAGR
jgi:hypothetical protein